MPIKFKKGPIPYINNFVNRNVMEWGVVVEHNRTISEWFEFPIGSSKVFLLQMQLDFVAHLKIVWHSMLIMPLLVLGI